MGDTTLAEGHSQYGVTGGGGGVTDHGALTGLSDNDHPQYLPVADVLDEDDFASNSATKPPSQQSTEARIDSKLSAFADGLRYQGTWNASTNSPTIPAAASGNSGYYYRVATAGTTSVDGIAEWDVGDWIISNGTTWQKLDNSEPTWSELQGKPAFTTVTYAASIAPDASLNKAFKCTLTGNVTLNKPTGASAGDIVSVDLIQDGTGSRTLTLGTGVSWSDEISDTDLSTAADTCDTLIMRLDPTGNTTNWVIIDYIKGEF